MSAATFSTAAGHPSRARRRRERAIAAMDFVKMIDDARGDHTSTFCRAPAPGLDEWDFATVLGAIAETEIA